jgi:hypothetical protein
MYKTLQLESKIPAAAAVTASPPTAAAIAKADKAK